MMEAARTSETTVNFYQTTRRYNPEDSHLHTHRRENLQSCLFYVMYFPQYLTISDSSTAYEIVYRLVLVNFSCADQIIFVLKSICKSYSVSHLKA
jgi:hypothetical protein